MLLFIPSSLFGQILEFDQNPPQVKWRQINSKDFQLIYPQELEKSAQKLASQIENLIDQVGLTHPYKPKKISIILQNQGVVSNGFVQMGPRKSEFFMTPPQDADMNDWAENLAVHELRHVAQIDQLTDYLGKPFFEQLGFALFGLILPSWFFEGDAVWYETVNTFGGRGRVPSWSMPLRANLLENKMFSYQKNYMGSYKDRTPGFYQLGYHMVSKMRAQESPDTFDLLIKEMRKNPLRPFNLSQNWKKLTGQNTESLHRVVMQDLKANWEKEQSRRQWRSNSRLTQEESAFPFDERLPQSNEDGDIIYLRTSAKHAPQIRLLDLKTGQQRTLAQLGWQTNSHFAHDKGWLVWPEIRKNPRYKQQEYQVIMRRDLKAGETRQLTKKTRLFAPALHADSETIAAIDISVNTQNSLVLLNLITGEQLLKIAAPEGVAWQHPSFHAQGQKIVMTGTSSLGMAIFEVSIESKLHPKVDQISPWSDQKLERPSYLEDDILFKGHFDGIDNIYLWKKKTHATWQLTEGQYGVFDPSPNSINDHVLLSEYTQNGFRLASFDPNSAGLKEINWEPSRQTFPANDTKSPAWISQSYPWYKNAINFHSLSVSAGELTDLFNQKIGLFWLSDDLLNQVQTRLGVFYDSELRRSQYSGSISFQRYLPKVSLSYDNRPKLGTFKKELPASQGSMLENQKDSLIFGRWREHYGALQVAIPLSFYHRNTFISTGLTAKTSLIDRYNLDVIEVKNRFVNQVRFPLEYHVYFTQNVRMASLDLSPRLGYHVSLSFRHLPDRNKVKGEHISFRSRLYLPGFFSNHSLALRFHAQHGWGSYQIANDIPMVSGYVQLAPTHVYNTLLTSYMLPLAYPDWSIGPLAYIDRIKGGVFADFENIDVKSRLAPRTLGLDIRMDFNLLRYYLPKFELGGKVIYVPSPARNEQATRTSKVENWLFTYGLSYTY